MKVKPLHSVNVLGQRLKRLRLERKRKPALGMELAPADFNSQVQTEFTPTNNNVQVPAENSTEPTFTIFPNLPLELQRKIWEFAAIPDRRIIEVHSTYKKNTNKCLNSFKWHFNSEDPVVYYTTTSPIPTDLLHVCSESRNVALRNYSFHTLFRRPFYFNEDTDILWVRGEPMIGINRIRCMIIYTPRNYPRGSRIHHNYKWRTLAIDYQTTHCFQDRKTTLTQQKCDWNFQFWYEYVLNGMTLEKIYLVYSKPDQKDEAVAEAKSMIWWGAFWFRRFSQQYPVFLPSGKISSFYRGSEWRRRHGLGFSAVPVEAILETELVQKATPR